MNMDNEIISKGSSYETKLRGQMKYSIHLFNLIHPRLLLVTHIGTAYWPCTCNFDPNPQAMNMSLTSN